MNTPTQTLVDISILEEFTNNKKKLMVNIVNILISDIPKDFHEMEASYEASEIENIRSIAHRCKSNVKLIAKKEFANKVETIEQYAKEDKYHEEIKTLIKQLKDSESILIEELKNILKTIQT